MPAEIAIIEPPNSVHYGSYVEEALQNSLDQPISFHQYKPHTDRLPPKQLHDGVIITGSDAHVYERDSWMKPMADRLLNILQENTPILGVCFGHQFLADILGGEIRPLCEREAGIVDVTLTELGNNSILFSDIENSFPAFAWHKDIVTELPQSSQTLAKNRSGIQAFHSNRVRAYGVQFHPECTGPLIEDLFSNVCSSQDHHPLAISQMDKRLDSVYKLRSVYGKFVSEIVCDHSISK